jgi:hypothetical protein
MYNSFLNTKVSDLEHSGVKGMKWGVRNAIDASKRVLGFGPKHADKAEVDAIQKKKLPKEMSNAELRKVTERLNLEQSYKAAIANSQPEGRKRYIRAFDKYAQQSTDAFVKTAAETGTRLVMEALIREVTKRKGS